jgi:hypothetical protein
MCNYIKLLLFEQLTQLAKQCGIDKVTKMMLSQMSKMVAIRKVSSSVVTRLQ